jgi:hypothetical protein
MLIENVERIREQTSTCPLMVIPMSGRHCHLIIFPWRCDYFISIRTEMTLLTTNSKIRNTTEQMLDKFKLHFSRTW